MLLWIICVTAAIVCGVAYVLYVTHHITIANQTIDKAAIVADTSGWVAWFQAKLLGWKTVILGWIAAGTQVVSLLMGSDLSPFKDLPWTLVFEQRIANYITFACAALIPITHAFGAKTYAAALPTNDGSA